MILSLMHIGRDYDISPTQIVGDLYYNNVLIISEGRYVGDPSWIDPVSPNCINNLIAGSVTQVEMSVGGGGVKDFQTIRQIYQANGGSFTGTNLYDNFVALKNTLPVVSLIDMDCEETYDQASFVAFCQMLIEIGFRITFCPYTYYSFWTGSLTALENSNPGSVVWWNLQCYDGGNGNDPQQWAGYITDAIPSFNTAGYILAGDWTDDSPAQMQALMQTFSMESAAGGGFIWTIDSAISGDAHGDLAAYVSAIENGLRP
ncbi:MAG TPA: hypothetical protein VGD01_06885 [Candidatus Elarobacter sp.]